MLQRDLTARCHDGDGDGAAPRAPIGDHMFKKHPQKWRDGPGQAIPRDLCRWYGMDDATYVNFVEQTEGEPGRIYTPELEAALQQLKQDALARARDQLSAQLTPLK